MKLKFRSITSAMSAILIHLLDGGSPAGVELEEGGGGGLLGIWSGGLLAAGGGLAGGGSDERAFPAAG